MDFLTLAQKRFSARNYKPDTVKSHFPLAPKLLNRIYKQKKARTSLTFFHYLQF